MDRVKLTGREQRDVMDLAELYGEPAAARAAESGWLETREEAAAVVRVVDEARDDGRIGRGRVVNSWKGERRDFSAAARLRERVIHKMGRSPYGL